MINMNGPDLIYCYIAFSPSAVYSLLRPKSLCLWGYLQRRGFWCIYVCTCNCSNSAKKKRRAPLTQKETAHAYSSVVWFSTASKSVVLKLQCLKTRDHATDVVRHLGTSCSFSTCFCLPFTLRGGRRVKIAVTQMMKRYYRMKRY